MREFDGETQGEEFVVTNHKKRPAEELRLPFKDYTNGKDMQKAIDDWAANP